MKALSLSRPWPWTILHAGKRIENRSRKDGRMPTICRYRGPLLLHAAKSWDKEAGLWMGERGLADQPVPTHLLIDGQAPDLHPAGAIVGRCRVVGHVEPQGILIRGEPNKPDSVEHYLNWPGWQGIAEWWMGGYALVLSGVQPTPVVFCRGHLGLWTVPDDIVERLDALKTGAFV